MFAAEIISIGDELTSGALVDTNSAYLSRELADPGIPVLCHTTVGDDLAALVGVFRAALSRSDLVLVTGGLGPTEDDLTRQAAAESVGVDLTQDLSAMEHIRALFEIRGRAMPSSNEIQSFFPRGARVIGNPHGTAPGFELEVCRGEAVPGSGRAKMLVFPGVPAELREMWECSGRRLSLNWQYELTGKRYTTVTRVLRTFGAGESDVESRLPHLIARDRDPRVGITAAALYRHYPGKYDLFYGGEETVYSQVGGDDLFWGFKHNWRHYFSFMHELHSGVVNDYALWAVVALALAILYALVVL